MSRKSSKQPPKQISPKSSIQKWLWSTLFLAILCAGSWWHFEGKTPKHAAELITKIPGAAIHQGLLTLQSWSNASGTRVSFSPRVELPMVDFILRWDAGSQREGEAAGLANLTRAVLVDGSINYTATALAEKLEGLGVHLNSKTTDDYTEISIRSLNDNSTLKATTEIIAELISKPAFREEDLDRNRKHILAEIDYRSHNPADLAMHAFYKALYANTPYGRDTLGTAASIMAFKSSDLVKFYKENYSTKNLSIAVVGALKSQDVADLVTKLSKDLSTHPLLNLEPMKIEKLTHSEHVTFPASQTKVLLGSLAVSKHDPDRYALLLGNNILGDNILNNRLAKELRLDRGLAYSPKSFFDFRAQSGEFIIKFATRTEQAKEAVQVARNVLEEFIKSGPTEDELNRIKKTVLGKLPLTLASNADLLNIAIDLLFYQLPLDEIERFQHAVKEMQAKNIHEAFMRHIDPKRLILVTVGADSAVGI